MVPPLRGTQAVLADEAFQRRVSRRVAFEKERGVASVSDLGHYAYLQVELSGQRSRPEQELEIYRRLAARGICINLLKLHRQGISFIVDEPRAETAAAELTKAGIECRVTPSVALLCVYAVEMRHLAGVMGRIAATLAGQGIGMVQAGDGPDRVLCLVERRQAEAALAALRNEFGVLPERRRLVVMKFGGKSVGTREARRLAAERV